MIRILALDCASEACSVALSGADGDYSRCQRSEREHGPLLLAMVDELLSEAGLQLAQLDALAVGCGPGSFTGLRIAAGISQGIAETAGLPLFPVSDLRMLAQAVIDEQGAEAVAVCLDARMGEVFTGFYRRDREGLAMTVSDDALAKPDELVWPRENLNWSAVGNGWPLVGEAEKLTGFCFRDADMSRLPEARFALPLALRAWHDGHRPDAAAARPVYLRDKVAWRRSGS